MTRRCSTTWLFPVRLEMEVEVLPTWRQSRNPAWWEAELKPSRAQPLCGIPRTQPRLWVPLPGCDLPVSPLRALQVFLERLAHPDCP